MRINQCTVLDATQEMCQGQSESIDCEVAAHSYILADLTHGKVEIINGEAPVKFVSVRDTPTCWGLPLAEVADVQSRDPELTIILNWVLRGEQPSEGALFFASPETNFCWINKERFMVMEGILYCRGKDSPELALVLPERLHSLALEFNHDLPSVGHQGIARTYFLMKEKFWW